MTLLKGFGRLGVVAFLLAIFLALGLVVGSTAHAATDDALVLQEEQVSATTAVVGPAHIPRFAMESIAITATNEAVQTTNDTILGASGQMLTVAPMVAATATVLVALLLAMTLTRIALTAAFTVTFRAIAQLSRRVIAFGGVPGISGRTKPIGLAGARVASGCVR